MSKNVIHNFDIVIENIETIKNSEELKEIFLKELEKISKEMSQTKDIVQLWNEYQKNNTATSPKKIESNNTLKEIQSPIVLGASDSVLKKTEQDSDTSSTASESGFFNIPDHTGRTADNLSTYNSNSTIFKKEENGFKSLNSGLTTKIYAGVSTQQSLLIPSKIGMTGNEGYSNAFKTEIKKKLNALFIGKNIDLNQDSAISKNIDSKTDQDYFAEKIEIEAQEKTENTYKISETSINNVNWKRLSELMIFKLSELSKEEKELYLKEYYGKLIKKITKSDISIQQLFSENEELFLLLKSIFPNLPEKISIQTQKTVYPDLGTQKMYPEIGAEKMYFRPSGNIQDKIKYKFNEKDRNDKLKDEGNIDYGFKMYDPRIGRIFAIEPLTKQHLISESNQFASNSTISGIDLDGYYFSVSGKFLGKFGNGNKVYIADKNEKNQITNARDLGIGIKDFIDRTHLTFGEGGSTDTYTLQNGTPKDVNDDKFIDPAQFFADAVQNAVEKYGSEENMKNKIWLISSKISYKAGTIQTHGNKNGIGISPYNEFNNARKKFENGNTDAFDSPLFQRNFKATITAILNKDKPDSVDGATHWVSGGSGDTWDGKVRNRDATVKITNATRWFKNFTTFYSLATPDNKKTDLTTTTDKAKTPK